MSLVRISNEFLKFAKPAAVCIAIGTTASIISGESMYQGYGLGLLFGAGIYLQRKSNEYEAHIAQTSKPKALDHA